MICEDYLSDQKRVCIINLFLPQAPIIQNPFEKSHGLFVEGARLMLTWELAYKNMASLWLSIVLSLAFCEGFSTPLQSSSMEETCSSESRPAVCSLSLGHFTELLWLSFGAAWIFFQAELVTQASGCRFEREHVDNDSLLY